MQITWETVGYAVAQILAKSVLKVMKKDSFMAQDTFWHFKEHLHTSSQ